MLYPNDKVHGRVIDNYITGNYGEDAYCEDDIQSCPVCSVLLKVI